MQAHLRSSLSNAESKDGDLGFIWFENFWWKYSHCKMSVLYSWFCRSPPAFCQGALLRGGSSEKENDLGEQASYQVGHCLPWPGLVWVRNLSSCQPSHLLAKLFGDSCAVLERVGPFHPSVSKPVSSGLTRTVQEKSSKLNLPWPVEIICLISSHHCPPFPRLSVLEHQIHHIFSKHKVKFSF